MWQELVKLGSSGHHHNTQTEFWHDCIQAAFWNLCTLYTYNHLWTTTHCLLSANKVAQFSVDVRIIKPVIWIHLVQHISIGYRVPACPGWRKLCSCLLDRWPAMTCARPVIIVITYLIAWSMGFDQWLWQFAYLLSRNWPHSPSVHSEAIPPWAHPISPEIQVPIYSWEK